MTQRWLDLGLILALVLVAGTAEAFHVPILTIRDTSQV